MRFSGIVGYATSKEGTPGVWSDDISEKTYRGDVVRNASRLEPPFQVPPEVNANVALEVSFSIVADAYAYDNFMDIRYVKWQGQAWTVTSVNVQRPRLILAIGGPWDGNTD